MLDEGRSDVYKHGKFLLIAIKIEYFFVLTYNPLLCFHKQLAINVIALQKQRLNTIVFSTELLYSLRNDPEQSNVE